MDTAQHLIYITNWHFNPETKNPFDESLPNLGELLKRKSKEGQLIKHLQSCCAFAIYKNSKVWPSVIRLSKADMQPYCIQNGYEFSIPIGELPCKADMTRTA